MKKQNIITLIATLSVLFFFAGCEFTDTPGQSGDNPTGDIDEGASIFRGYVMTQDSIPLVGAHLNFDFGAADPVGVTTADSGKYVVEIVLGAKKTVVVTASMEEYKSASLTLSADINIYIDVPNFYLEPLDGTGDSTVAVSGDVASIYLAAQSKESIGIKEAGDDESVMLTFGGLDSSGTSIDINHKETMKFTLVSSLNGGEYLFPETAVTDEKGQAVVTLNSGTIAGVLMVQAEITKNGTIIKSRPIPIAVHGGFPDANHFSVGSETLNYPFYGIIGKDIIFTAYIADKYSNPPRPNTTVYYNTTSGIIEGSAKTDNLGVAGVTLLTNVPMPYLEEYGNGFFRVIATTKDETNTDISTSCVRLLSGVATVSSSNTAIDIPNGGSQSFTITLDDQFGNPLAAGQNVAISADTKGKVKISENRFTMEDTMSKLATNFSFFVSDDEPDSVNVQPITLKIETSGPNGTASTTISGTTR